MRLIFIRHGDPDYSCDGLTERGKLEARALATRVAKWNIDEIYCSPMGRAVETAAPSLEVLGKQAITVPWLREYSYPVDNLTHGNNSVCWDRVPSEWTAKQDSYTMTDWLNVMPAKSNPLLKEQYSVVTNGIDEILAEYGYIRKDNYYINNNSKNRRYKSTVLDPSHHLGDTLPESDAAPVLVFFCHFGVIELIVSHLINIPFQLLVHGFVIPPTGVTILNTEERWDDEAYFRVQTMGDVSHLKSEGVRVSSAGSFAPVFQG